MFQGSGQVFTTLGECDPHFFVLQALMAHIGFEYWANPDNPTEGFITWQSNGQPSYRLGAGAMGPDMGVNGSMVGQRRIPEEPLVSIHKTRPIYLLTLSLFISQLFLTWVYRVSYYLKSSVSFCR